MSGLKKQKIGAVDTIIMRLDHVAFNDEQAKEKLYVLCREEIEKNKDSIDLIFEKWFALGTLFKGNPQKNGLLLYKLTSFISSRKYIPRYHKNQTNFQAISHIPEKYTSEFCDLLQTTLEVKDFTIIEKPSFISQGNVGDIAATIFNIYKGCIANYQLEPELMTKLSKCVKPFAQKFPNNEDYCIPDALEHHPNAIETTAEILTLLIDKKAEKGLMPTIVREMISPFSRDDYYHKHSVEITTQLLLQWKGLPETKKNWFLELFLKEGFGINLKSQHDQVVMVKKGLALLMYDPEKYKTGIKNRQENLQELEDNFETIQKNNWKRAYKKIAVNPQIRKTLELLAKQNGSLANTVHIQQLLQDAKNFKNAPKLYSLNQKPSVVFSDLHFKLWVINELMYKKKLLTPRFDLEKLAEEHTTREISREDDGYSVIPEVKKYFKNVGISEELLLKVESIEISYTSEIYNHLWPFCDAGCGDELLSVSNKMISDLALLPNLKKIIGLEELKPSNKVIKVLEEKGVILEKCVL
ncbi:MAG: hypothetical protein COA95_04965 [Methylophaga sp.]|nr:MAG: hypothetical protein COA95_04965 [Methylophaga sp.]